MPTFMLIAGGADVDKRSGNNPKLAPVMLERYARNVERQGAYLGLLGATHDAELGADHVDATSAGRLSRRGRRRCRSSPC